METHEAVSPCACTVFEYERSIPAGATGKVRAVLDTTGMNGSTAKTIRLLTNDPASPELALTMKAEIRPLVVIYPGYVRFLRVQGHPGDPDVQLLWVADGNDLEVLEVEAPLEYLSVRFREARPEERQAEGAARQWVVETQLAPDAPVGPLADHLVVHTTHPRHEKLKVPVSGFVQSIFSLRPARADFGEIEAREPTTFSLEVQNSAPEAVSLREVESDVVGLRAEIVPVVEGRSYYLHLTLPPGMPGGPFQGRVKIHTSSPHQPTIEVQVRGTIR